MKKMLTNADPKQSGKSKIWCTSRKTMEQKFGSLHTGVAKKKIISVNLTEKTYQFSVQQNHKKQVELPKIKRAQLVMKIPFLVY